MKFRVRKRDLSQWHRRFAFIPTKVAETDGHSVYVWLGWYETRRVKSRYPYYDFENRRIGSHSGAIVTVRFDTP